LLNVPIFFIKINPKSFYFQLNLPDFLALPHDCVALVFDMNRAKQYNLRQRRPHDKIVRPQRTIAAALMFAVVSNFFINF
jgi:hypothetical protein